jgi:hypothetical protein
MRKISRFSLLAALMVCSVFLVAQNKQQPAPVKMKPCLFKGKWQLVQTFAVGALHPVKKDEYDGVICFRSFHRYYEEVNYESNHWIIAGKWHVNREKGTLELTERNYTLGKLEEHPEDIIFDILQSDKKNWSGASTDRGQAVKVFYSRIAKH